MKLTDKQINGINNYRNADVRNDLLLLHNIRSNLWALVLKYENNQVLKTKLEEAFTGTSESFLHLETMLIGKEKEDDK